MDALAFIWCVFSAVCPGIAVLSRRVGVHSVILSCSYWCFRHPKAHIKQFKSIYCNQILRPLAKKLKWHTQYAVNTP